MKVIFANRYFFPDHSATSQLLADLAFHLAGSGFDVHVVASRQRYDDPRARLAPREVVRGVTVHRVWTTSFGRRSRFGRALDYLTFSASAAWRLALLARKGDMVVAMTDPPLFSLAAWPVTWLRGARLVNWLQDLFPEAAAALGVRGFTGNLAAFLRWLRDRSLRAAASNVVPGEGMRAHLYARGIAGERLAVIENWADGAAIRPIAAHENALRREWGLDGKFVVGYSGNMGWAHEFGTLLDAMERLRDRSEVAFVFIGGGAYRDWLEEQARERGIANLRFLPYQPRELLAQSLGVPDVHLVSLREELEGLVLPSKFYGIAAAGRPVLFIGARDGDIAGKITRFECGAAIAPGHAKALAEAIEELAHDGALRERLGGSARAAFESTWDARIAFGKWTELLRRVAARDA